MRKTWLLLLPFLAAACSGDKSPKVDSVMQKSDKYLSCNDVKLEMNEAQFYERTAEDNKDFHAKYLLMPLGYVSTYMSAEDAMQTSRERVQYLQSIYDILNCDRKERQMMTGPSGYMAPEGSGYAPTSVYPQVGPGSYNMPQNRQQYGGVDNRYARQPVNYGDPL